MAESAETSGKPRRDELASFLRNRRERVGPEEFGLAPGSRRRTPGLRREELAQLAGVGITWYTWLEQGRPINVSVQVLDAIARVLRLGTSERWHLYRLAQVPGVPVPATCQPVETEVLGVLDALDPSPACLYNARYDLIACNAAYASLFPSLVNATGIERNALWQLFARPDGLRAIEDTRVCAAMIANLRANYANHVGDPAWVELIDALTTASTEFAATWATHPVGVPTPVTKAFDCLGLGTVRVRATGFSVAEELRMVVYLPESPADVALLAKLRARQESPVRTA